MSFATAIYKAFKCIFRHTSHVVSLVKIITIRDEVYRKLLAVKRKDESFSELFDRLAEGKDSIETLTKLRATVEFGHKDEMLSELYSLRAERRR
jgi:predicted CopG family antitoxin